MEGRLRRHDQHGGRGVGGGEPVDHGVERRVGQHIGIVGEEVLVGPDVLAHPAQPLADRRLQPGVDERDRPVRHVRIEQLDLTGAHDEVVGFHLAVVQEEVLDHRLAVTEAQDEFLVAVVGVVAHHVPQQRAGPDHLQRLGDQVALGHPHAHPVTAAEKHYFHHTHPFRPRIAPRAAPHSGRPNLQCSAELDTSGISGRTWVAALRATTAAVI